MKRLILLHIVCCCFLVGKADYEMNTDSLIQVFQNLPHDSTRLVALNNIIRIEQNNPKCIQFSDTLMKEALFRRMINTQDWQPIITYCTIITTTKQTA